MTPNKTSNILFFSNRYRYFILFLVCLCLTSISSNMIALNFTIICMAPNNNTSLSHGITFTYTQHEKSMLNWAVGVGSIIGTFLFSWFYSHYGARFVFLFAGVTSTISTVFIPVAVEMNLWMIMTGRFFQGISYAGNFACIGIICSIWAPLKENGIFLAILTSYTPLSMLITNPIAGILCETLGWPSVYYSHAAASALLFALWYLFYLDKPQKHCFVSNKEIDELHKNKSIAHINMDSFIPYWEICKNPVILTVWFNALADIGTLVFLYMYGPTYFAKVLKFGITKIGLLGSFTVILTIIVRFLVGYASDKWKTKSERVKMVGFNSLALLSAGILFLLLGYVPNYHPWTGYWITVALNCFLGANCGGFYKCAILVSRQYSHFIISNIQFITCITLFAAPALVRIFVMDDTSREQWRHVFFVLGILLISANTLFCFMATDQPAEFTKISRKEKEVSLEEKISS